MRLTEGFLEEMANCRTLVYSRKVVLALTWGATLGPEKSVVERPGILYGR